MVRSLTCPKTPAHGPMQMGVTSVRWERGLGRAKPPLTVELVRIPAFVCESCERDGRHTFQLPPDFDDELTSKIFKPINSALSRTLRDYSHPLPTLKLVFGENTRTDNQWPSTQGAAFSVREPSRNFSHLVLAERTFRQLDLLKVLSLKRRLVFQDWGMESILGENAYLAANFYGPSGTGKTLAAEALAGELGRGFLPVNYAELESKFVGETPKNIERVFDLAERESAILFFDEADSFVGRRVTEVQQSADYAVNVTRSVMMIRLEQFRGLALFATNLIGNYDPAFARRLPLTVRFPLPHTANLRERLWRIHVAEGVPLASDVDFGKLGERFEGLSGGDIKNSVVMAILNKVAEDGPDEEKTIMQVDFERAASEIIAAKSAILGTTTQPSGASPEPQ